MSNTARLTIGIIWLILSALEPLAAQDGRAAVEGTVFDSSGRVLVGADVFLRDLDSGLEVHRVTGNRNDAASSRRPDAAPLQGLEQAIVYGSGLGRRLCHTSTPS